MRVRRVLLAGLIALLLCSSCTSPQQPTASLNPTAISVSGKEFTLIAGGDVLIHPALTEQAVQDGAGQRDFTKIFAGVKNVISQADLAICHLEVPIAAAEGPFKGYPNFSAPPEVVQALADAGYDTCSTASNHTLDQGDAGVRRTLDALDSVGLKHTGSARSATEAAQPALYQVNGVKIGHISFTFGFNGISLPSDKPWLANKLDTEAVLTAARKAKAAGAELTVASLHWGVEYRHDPTTEQRRIAELLLANPAIDLIVEHHAHVVQPFAKFGNKWVAYGLGNHLAKHEQPRGVTEEGVLSRFHFRKEAEGWRIRTEYIPTLVELGPPIRLTQLTTATTPRQTQALQRIDRIVHSAGVSTTDLPFGSR